MARQPDDTLPALHVLSSMATRHLLGERVAAYRDATGRDVRLTAIGGVDAARRVRAGESVDVVVLASGALRQLRDEAHLRASPWLDWVDSGVAVAVPDGAPLPALDSESAVRAAVQAAVRIGLSTGPSGVALSALFAQWQVDAARIVEAPPGVPVAALLARREVDLGFQQLSELIGCAGIRIAGPLPTPIQVTTTFSAAVGAAAPDPVAAAAFVAYLADPAGHATVARHGMTLHLQENAP